MKEVDRTNRSLAIVLLLSWCLSSGSYWLILGSNWGLFAVVANGGLVIAFVGSCFVSWLTAWVVRGRTWHHTLRHDVSE